MPDPEGPSDKGQLPLFSNGHTQGHSRTPAGIQASCPYPCFSVSLDLVPTRPRRGGGDYGLLVPNDGITHFLGSSPKGVVLGSQEAAKQPDNPPACPPENSTELMDSTQPPGALESSSQIPAASRQHTGLWGLMRPQVGTQEGTFIILSAGSVMGNSNQKLLHDFLNAPVGLSWARPAGPTEEKKRGPCPWDPAQAPMQESQVLWVAALTSIPSRSFAFTSCAGTSPSQLSALLFLQPSQDQGQLSIAGRREISPILLFLHYLLHPPVLIQWPEA